MKLKDPPRLIIHEHGASFSVRVKRGRRWRWEHFCTQIEWTDYQRLLESEQLRLRWLEKKTGCTFVVPDTGYVDQLRSHGFHRAGWDSAEPWPTVLERLGLGDAALMDSVIADTAPEPRWIYKGFSTELESDGRLACGLYGFEGGAGHSLDALAIVGLAPLGMEALFEERIARIRDKIFAHLKSEARSSIEVRNPPPNREKN